MNISTKPVKYIVVINKIFRTTILLSLIGISAVAVEKKQYTLPEIVELGIKVNPILSSHRYEIEARKAAYESSKRFTNPEIEFHKGRAESHDNLTERNTSGISLSQPIENPFARHHRIRASEKEWRSTEHFYALTKLELVHDIKKLFHQILLFRNKLDLAEKNLESIRETHALIKKRAELGEVKELEAIKLYVETLKAENIRNKIQTELELAKDRLNKTLAYQLSADFQIRGDLSYIPLELEEETLVTKTLMSYPVIKKKETEIEAAESLRSYAKWQRLPDFKLTGFSHDELDGRNTGVGISLDLPLWNFKGKEIAEAEYRLLKQKDELRALLMEVSTEVKTRLNKLRLSAQTLQVFHEGLLAQAEASLRIAEISYKQGEISLLDYLDSQRTYYSILNDYQESLYTWNADKAALEKAVGEEFR